MLSSERGAWILGDQYSLQMARFRPSKPGLLEAAGISSELRGESLRKTHGLTLDGLGMVEYSWRPLTKIGRGRSSPRLRAVTPASMTTPRSALLEASAQPNGSD